MNTNFILYGAIALFIVGIIMLATSNKNRLATGDWSNTLQWGYLLMMIGVFGMLSAGLAWSFTAVLLLFTAFTGAVWLWQKLSRKGQPETLPDSNHLRDYMAGFFPIIAVVFVVRTFIVEPFQIPSSSMRSGLVKGDFILVNKFSYGIRVPVLNTVAIPTGSIQRGDVVVFNYPVEPQNNYIKRIVAVGGDTVEYKDKILTVNGKASVDVPQGGYTYPDDGNSSIPRQAERFQSTFEGKTFDVLKVDGAPSVDAPTWNHYQAMFAQTGFESGLQQNCEYAEDGSGFKCKVPAGKYFAMGDNRDNSADSRYWGFVDDKLIVGKAFMIWLNTGDMSRVGTMIK